MPAERVGTDAIKGAVRRVAAAVAACARPRRRRELNTRHRHLHRIADPLRVPRNPHAIDGFARPREILLAA